MKAASITSTGRKFLAEKVKFVALAACILALTYIILKNPQTAADGARNGLSLCAGVIIPTLFPFMVLCSFCVNSGLCEKLGQRLEFFTRPVFRLPGVCACAVILGLVGGYPVGIRTAAQLHEQGSISRNQAFRLSLFCVNAGPAFVIGTVGASVTGSKKAGVILFVSLTLASLVTGFLTRFLCSINEKSPQLNIPKTYNRAKGETEKQKALVVSVSEGSGAMLSMCSWVVLFSSLSALLDCLPESLLRFAEPARYVLEVTAACGEAAEKGCSLPVFAAILGWAGLSVILQILPYATQCGCSLSVMLASRCSCAALSTLFCYNLCRFFPLDSHVGLSLSDDSFSAFSSSAPAAAGLLLMCALLILDCAAGSQRILPPPSTVSPS